MEDRRFDDLARVVAIAFPRRTVGRLFAGGAFVALIPGLRPPTVAARCVKPGKKCERGDRCCKGTRCRRGRCRCKRGRDVCKRRCRDLRTDPEFCGSCSTACRTDQTCIDGVCECPPGETECSGECVSLQSDTDNCGDCGVECPAGERCQGSCCTLPGADCDPEDDHCCGESICVGLVNSCCGISGRTPCNIVFVCCSGACGPNGLCA